MKKKVLALLLCVLLIGLLAACGEDAAQQGITQQKACQIAVEDAGYTVTEVTGLHAHEMEQDGAPAYQIHFSCGEASYTYMIHGETGEILSKQG